MGLFDKLFDGTKRDSNVEPPKNTNFNSSDKLMDEDQFGKLYKQQKTIQMATLKNNKKS